MLTSGCQCNACLAGTMQTRSVYSRSEWHTRYLVCDRCGHKSQEVVEASRVSRRKRSPLKQTGSGPAVNFDDTSCNTAPTV